MFSEVGGVMNLIMMIGILLVSPVSQLILQQMLAGEVFDFKSHDDEDQNQHHLD